MESDIDALDNKQWGSAIFLSENGDPIEFHFRLKDFELIEKCERVVEYHSGVCIKSIHDLTPRTVVIVENDCTDYTVSRPLFKLAYIVDCLKSNRLLPLTDYLHNRNFKYRERDFLDVIFFKTNIFKDSNNYLTPNDILCKNLKQNCAKQRFSHAERTAILKFLIGKNLISKLKKNWVWIQMEKYNICPKRTHQSLKNHFFKSLVHNLKKFDFLTQNQICQIEEASSHPY